MIIPISYWRQLQSISYMYLIPIIFPTCHTCLAKFDYRWDIELYRMLATKVDIDLVLAKLRFRILFGQETGEPKSIRLFTLLGDY